MTSFVPQMSAKSVLELVGLFEINHIEVIVDGGWAVDALLGVQTRPHEDLDIAIPHRHVPLARQLLEARGYTDVPRNDTRDCNFVLGDTQGHQVDFHTYSFDEQGTLVFGLPYPPDSLNGNGSILGHSIRCITPEWLVKFHTGYAFDENDFKDVTAICERFNIFLPQEYREYSSSLK